MDPDGAPKGCPPWIDPGTAFRLDVKCGRYAANLDYGVLEMAEEDHELWITSSSGYNLDKFREEMSAVMIWGNSQIIDVWAVDSDSDAKWKLRRNEHFEKMIQSRLNDRFAKLVVEVVTKDGYDPNLCFGGSMAASGVTTQAIPGSASGASSQANPGSVSGATNHAGLGSGGDEGFGDTHTSPNPMEFPEINWDSLVIMPEADEDGDPKVVVDEDLIYEAMGFMHSDETQQGRGTAEAAGEINLEEEMRQAGDDVNDNAPEEPELDWDRENPDVSVGAVFPCMYDFRMALKQHAVVKEFRLGTEKSDKERFRGFCKAAGCPWVIRARTQANNSVRVQINSLTHTCAAAGKIGGTMASQAWGRGSLVLSRQAGTGAPARRADVGSQLGQSGKYLALCTT